MQLYDIIGDLHSCFQELSQLLDKLGYEWDNSKAIYKPPDRQAIFVGDITDRGPYSLACFAYVKMMVEAGFARCVLGNHDDKLYRYLIGRDVTINNGLERTVREIKQANVNKHEMANFLKSLPKYLVLDNGNLIVVHAAWRDDLMNERYDGGLLRSWTLFGPTTGKKLQNGLPDRIDWASQRQIAEESPWIVYGHQPMKEVRFINKTIGIDTGCVFGNKLSCLRWPSLEVVSVDSNQCYSKHPSGNIK